MIPLGLRISTSVSARETFPSPTSVSTATSVTAAIVAWVAYWTLGRTLSAGWMMAILALAAVGIAFLIARTQRIEIHAWSFVGTTALLDSFHPMNVWLINLAAPLAFYAIVTS